MIKCTRNNDFGTYNLFTGKEYNFNENISIDERKKQLKEILNMVDYSFSKYVSPKQKNTSIVKKVTLENMDNKFEDVDGLITNLKDLALFTRVNDDQAILLYDPVNKVIGNIHSGINGTLNKIIVNAIDLMIKEYNCNPNNIQVCIYPSILKCCSKVKKDMIEQFKTKFSDIDKFINYNKEDDAYYIDCVGINKNEMIEIGINEKNIIISDICTSCNSSDYYSMNAKNDKTGCHLAIIYMKK